ncbi:hypothetical protein B296_00008778 [Ensete ventricosum]|uniref:Uncharacterized protein n=1 Tax=Ensete ventricosum TaxID=4639 RepID=A0A427AT26_ENSVE|nr:hypothetical protein B296_00008778 [Ensete ventricosum]
MPAATATITPPIDLAFLDLRYNGYASLVPPVVFLICVRCFSSTTTSSPRTSCPTSVAPPTSPSPTTTSKQVRRRAGAVGK